MGQIAAGTSGVVVDGASYGSSTSSFPYAPVFGDGRGTGGPKAYLNWLVFDRDFNPITALNGYARMSAAPSEHGQDVAHEKLASPDIIITQPGYVYVYLSNEEASPVEVYFDDLKVTQIKSPVVQTDDYYPFGLAFNEYQRENSLINNYQYNGKEKQDELNLGWLDYGARMYMPEIGRWGVVDPLSEKYYSQSVFNYTADDPIRLVDPNGKEIWISFQEAKTDKNGDVKRKKNGEIKYKTKLIEFKPGEKYDGNNKFVSQAFSAMNNLREKKADINDVIGKLSESSKKVTIKQSEYNSERKKKVDWNPTAGLLTTDGEKQSPQIGLLHELGHAFGEIFDKKAFNQRSNEPLRGWDDAEEKNTILKYENPAAIILGEGTRQNHKGSNYPTNGPTSTTPKEN